jgi:prepilin-type N-terminal cleavage/methylation domain-containing protein
MPGEGKGEGLLSNGKSPHPSPLPAYRERGKEAGKPHRRRGGFTLIEVTATMLLIAIVLPSIMEGVAQSTAAAARARSRNEVCGLAQGKLAEILSGVEWQNGNLSGDFGEDWPGYKWQATVQPWPDDTTTQSIQEIDLVVTWTQRNREQSLTVSSLAYLKGLDASSSTSTSTTSTP